MVEVTLWLKGLPGQRGTPGDTPGGAASLFCPLCPLCPLSLLLTPRVPASLQCFSISLSALLSPQPGSCSTILPSRVLPPAPNARPPSVSPAPSSSAELGRSSGGAAASALRVGLVLALNTALGSMQTCVLTPQGRAEAQGGVESDTSSVRVVWPVCTPTTPTSTTIPPLCSSTTLLPGDVHRSRLKQVGCVYPAVSPPHPNTEKTEKNQC